MKAVENIKQSLRQLAIKWLNTAEKLEAGTMCDAFHAGEADGLTQAYQDLTEFLEFLDQPTNIIPFPTTPETIGQCTHGTPFCYFCEWCHQEGGLI